LYHVWLSSALGGLLPPNGSLPAAKFTLRPSFAISSLLHGSRAVGVSQSLRRGTRNGITEVSQTAPPIFVRAAITLGIGPHCSLQRLNLTFKMHILERINKFNSGYHTFPLQNASEQQCFYRGGDAPANLCQLN